jgi:hypothetical protein
MHKVWVKSGLNPNKISIIRQGQAASYCLDSKILAKRFFVAGHQKVVCNFLLVLVDKLHLLITWTV